MEPGPFDKSCFQVSKKMIRLLRHDSSVPGEEDGPVEFKILAQMFRSEFTSSQHWSIRTWLNHLQKKRRTYSIVWIHSMLIPSYTFEQFKAILEGNPHCPNIARQRFVIERLRHSIIQFGLIPGGRDVKKGRHEVFFTAVNPMYIAR